MTKLKKNKIAQEEVLHKNERLNEKTQKHKMDEQTVHLMDSPQKKMSQGALFISRIQKTRSAWGNKQLFGSNEKGRGKPGHKTPKTQQTKHQKNAKKTK